MIKYITAANESSASQIIEKSKFIAYVKSVGSKEEADAFFDEIRKKHKDASHNVPVLILGEKKEFMWSSDDGEPGGTAGTPILQLLLCENLTNVAVMVTRYFGGIKLGTGGLARAYSGTAKMALEQAGRKEVREYRQRCFQIPYSCLSKFQKKADELHYEITDTVFAEDVIITVKYEPENEQLIETEFFNISLGKIKNIY